MTEPTIEDVFANTSSGKLKGLFNEDTRIKGARKGGRIVSLKVQQKTNYTTQKPDFWPSGDPKREIVIGVQTDDRDEDYENDTGVRGFYLTVGSGQFKKMQDVLKTEGLRAPEEGHEFYATFLGKVSKTSKSGQAYRENDWDFEYAKKPAAADVWASDEDDAVAPF